MRLTLSLLTAGLFRFLVGFLRGLERLCRVFHGLFGKFVAGQMIFFAVMYGSRSVRMRCQFVNLRCPLMKTLWHSLLSHNSRFVGPKPKTELLVTSGIERSLGQSQPRKLFGSESYIAPGVRRYFVAYLPAGATFMSIAR